MGSTLSVSLDGGVTWIKAKQLRRVAYGNSDAGLDDITTMGPGNYREFAPTVKNAGTVDLQGVWAETDPGQAALAVAFDAQMLCQFRHQFAPIPGQTSGWLRKFSGYVAQRPSFDARVDKASQLSSSIRITGGFTDSASGSTDFQNASGSVSFFAGHPTGNPGWFAVWSAFGLVPGVSLPEDAAILGIYPVMVASNSSNAIATLSYGVGASWSSVGTQFATPSGSYTDVELSSNVSIGTTLAALTGQQMMAALGATLEDPFTGSLTVSALGFAIYYRSATPLIDPSIPAPFAVPFGQGLAWALPAAAVAGPVITGDFNGSAMATPVIL